MSEENAHFQKVREMARLSILTNKLNPIQEKNMILFPFVFFEGVKEVAINYDLSSKALADSEEDKKKMEITYKFDDIDTSHFLVSYRLNMVGDEKNENLPKRFEALQNAVRLLFWKDTKIEVYFNDILVYQSNKE